MAMQGKKRERWEDLCAQAADEQDPEKLLELVKEINQLLEEKEQRLINLRKPPGATAH
jgi:hypothetical protein